MLPATKQTPKFTREHYLYFLRRSVYLLKSGNWEAAKFSASDIPAANVAKGMDVSFSILLSQKKEKKDIISTAKFINHIIVNVEQSIYSIDLLNSSIALDGNSIEMKFRIFYQNNRGQNDQHTK